MSHILSLPPVPDTSSPHCWESFSSSQSLLVAAQSRLAAVRQCRSNHFRLRFRRGTCCAERLTGFKKTLREYFCLLLRVCVVPLCSCSLIISTNPVQYFVFWVLLASFRHGVPFEFHGFLPFLCECVRVCASVFYPATFFFLGVLIRATSANPFFFPFGSSHRVTALLVDKGRSETPPGCREMPDFPFSCAVLTFSTSFLDFIFSAYSCCVWAHLF